MANPDDARHAPSPLGGWSDRITPVPDALIVTTAVPDMIQPMGVFDASGNYLHQAVLWRGRPLMTEPPRVPPLDRLSGRWIWGGVLLNHFGHFLTESTGRLWAVDAVAGPVDGIVFVSKREGSDTGETLDLKPFHRLFLGLAGIDLPVRIVTRPTRVDMLEVPGQAFGIGSMASGTAQFRAFMQRRFGHDVAPVPSEGLYVSRSGLSAARGGILEEARLETLLAAEGYEVFHPERHTLTEQIARYKGARRIVALDGSALHLVAMAGVQGQPVAVIKRRDSRVSDGILRHLQAFLGTSPTVIDVIRQDWVRSDRRRADRFSIGELDFAALGRALAKAGFVSPNADWPALTTAETAAAIKAAERELRRQKLTFRPSVRGAPVPPVEAPPTPAPPLTSRQQRRRAAQAAQAAQVEQPDRAARRAARLARREGRPVV